MTRHLPLCFLLVFLSSCLSLHAPFSPALTPPAAVSEEHQVTLTLLPPLSDQDKSSSWGTELLVGQGFLQQHDLYRAITSFKRALLLAPSDLNHDRLLEIHYGIIVAYYLGEKYPEVVATFEASPLPKAAPSFPHMEQLAVILEDSYRKIEEKKKADNLLSMLKQATPPIAEKLTLYHALAEGQDGAIDAALTTYSRRDHVEPALNQYRHNRLSPNKARILNALLPGAGYWYSGQKQSALTSFSLNTLFIIAAYQAFHHGHHAAGIVLTSFEGGWYFGGIHGAALSVQNYNERLYNHMAAGIATQERLFPVLMLNFTF